MFTLQYNSKYIKITVSSHRSHNKIRKKKEKVFTRACGISEKIFRAHNKPRKKNDPTSKNT